MKIVVMGGTGLIGKGLVKVLKDSGLDVTVASASTGVNLLSGEGIAEALQGAQVLVDVTNSPSFEDSAVMNFFTTAAMNLLPAAKTAGVKHVIALSVVGADSIPDSGYMRAKAAQETAIRNSGLPYTILRATQFYEFLGAIVWGSTVNGEVRVPKAWIQPIAAEDVVKVLADLALSPAVDGVVEVAGPERSTFVELLGRVVAESGSAVPVIEDEAATYFGARITTQLTPSRGDARLGGLGFGEWALAKKQKH